MADSFRGAISKLTVHLCIDMPRIFSNEGPWTRMARVLPRVFKLPARFPERTEFTRFVTPRRLEDVPGMWRRYFERWRNPRALYAGRLPRAPLPFKMGVPNLGGPIMTPAVSHSCRARWIITCALMTSEREIRFREQASCGRASHTNDLSR